MLKYLQIIGQYPNICLECDIFWVYSYQIVGLNSIIVCQSDTMSFDRIVKNYSEVPISRSVILNFLKDYRRPNDKISELIKNNELISIRRGLYIVGPNMDMPGPEPFLIANHLRNPSYVTLESALSYWNMIPEKAYEISSVTMKTSKTYKTQLGRFSYKQLKTPYYSYGIKSIRFSSQQTVLIASREKALCDKIVLTPNINLRSIRQTREFLMEDMRMEYDVLSSLDWQLMDLWVGDAPKKSSLKMLVNTLEKL